jgi:hypothetical protein
VAVPGRDRTVCSVFSLPSTITSFALKSTEVWRVRRAVDLVLTNCLVDVLNFLLSLIPPPHVLLPWILLLIRRRQVLLRFGLASNLTKDSTQFPL